MQGSVSKTSGCAESLFLKDASGHWAFISSCVKLGNSSGRLFVASGDDEVVERGPRDQRLKSGFAVG